VTDGIRGIPLQTEENLITDIKLDKLQVAVGVEADLFGFLLETLAEARLLSGLKLEEETCRVGKNSKRRLVKHCNG